MRLERKIEARLLDYYANDPGTILLIDGARQTGKSFIIRDTARKHFRHYVEINLFEDSHGAQVFRDVDTVDKFHLALSLVAGKELGSGKEDTIVFLDEIQEYGKLLPLLKFINQDGRYRYIASGSALGVELSRTSSIPMGSITIERLFPLDFEEFLWAAGVAKDLIAYLRSIFKEGKEVEYHQNGKVKSTICWRDGKKDGLSTEYYEDGTKMLEMSFEADVINGVELWYHANGTIISKTPFVNGEICGIQEIFSPEGILQESREWVRGEVHFVKEYHENGILRSAVAYDEEDRKQGIGKYYDKEGNLEREVTYDKDIICGIVREYNKNGRVSESVYENGKKVSSKEMGR